MDLLFLLLCWTALVVGLFVLKHSEIAIWKGEITIPGGRVLRGWQARLVALVQIAVTVMLIYWIWRLYAAGFQS